MQKYSLGEALGSFVPAAGAGEVAAASEATLVGARVGGEEWPGVMVTKLVGGDEMSH